MKVCSFDVFRGLFGDGHKLTHGRGGMGLADVIGLGDIYAAHLVEKLNYCRHHPKSSKCQ